MASCHFRLANAVCWCYAWHPAMPTNEGRLPEHRSELCSRETWHPAIFAWQTQFAGATHGILPCRPTRAGSPNTEASCVHAKHGVLPFSLGKRSLLVLRMASCHADQRGPAPRTPKRAVFTRNMASCHFRLANAVCWCYAWHPAMPTNEGGLPEHRSEHQAPRRGRAHHRPRRNRRAAERAKRVRGARPPLTLFETAPPCFNPAAAFPF
jgi:hypothetical protein